MKCCSPDGCRFKRPIVRKLQLADNIDIWHRSGDDDPIVGAKMPVARACFYFSEADAYMIAHTIAAHRVGTTFKYARFRLPA